MEIKELWEQIEESERYLVSLMHKEAASSAFFVIENLREIRKDCDNETYSEMGEAAAMVLIQAYRHTGRTLDMFVDLKLLFGSLFLVPHSVFFTGICMQIYDENYHLVREILDEFLNGWDYDPDDACYIPSRTEALILQQCRGHCSVSILSENYVQMVEIYAVNLLVKGLKNSEAALKWLGRANISEEARQGIKLKILSFAGLQLTSSTTIPSNVIDQNLSKKDGNYPECEASHVSREICEIEEEPCIVDDCKVIKSNSNFSRFSKLVELLSSWFPNFVLKLKKLSIMPDGYTTLIWVSALLALYFLRRKWSSVKSNMKAQSTAIFRMVRDFWQLAFNVQLNPLAAVQSLPTTSQFQRQQ